jgi:hypothetical protein
VAAVHGKVLRTEVHAGRESLSMANKPFILFITGTSASGKTTIYERLKNDPQLQGIIFHDIDEHGVPQVGREVWRRYRVEELLYNAIGDIKEERSSVICGIANPHEIIESRYYQPAYNIHFLLVETAFETIRKRLLQRIEAQTAKGVFDESFSESFKDELLTGNKEWKRILASAVANQKNGNIIDASELSIEDMYAQTRQIIDRINPQGVEE